MLPDLRALLLALSVLTAACRDDEPDDSTAPPPAAVDAVTSATPNVPEVVLGDDHTGWTSPDCLTCHEELHTTNLDDSSCAACHGANGAPQRPSGHDDAGCSDCHPEPHESLSSAITDDCRSCHGYGYPAPAAHEPGPCAADRSAATATVERTQYRSGQACPPRPPPVTTWPSLPQTGGTASRPYG